MSKIFVVGARPLPIENSNTLFALGLRTWHFVKPLLNDGHQVYLVAGTIPPSKNKIDTELREKKTIDKNLILHSIFDNDLYFNRDFIQSLHDGFQPDCIVGINTLPSSVAAGIHTEKPLWLDLNGALMTEAQARASVLNNNSTVSEFWNQEKNCLLNGDIFSTVSLTQKYMLLGELGAMKRLNQYTIGYEFAWPIPNAVENCNLVHKKIVLRDVHVKNEDFVILWTGGYNTWTDIDFLYQGISNIMEKYSHVKYISTGGAIPLHNEITYERFLDKIKSSPYKDRFIMLGWVPTEDTHYYYMESDLGINIDCWNYETLTGARNRLIHMMKVGLPVLTTLGSEISHVIDKNRIGLTCPIGNLQEFTSCFEYAINNREALKIIGEKGREFIQQNYTYEKTNKPLRDWVSNPQKAPDWKKMNMTQKPAGKQAEKSVQMAWDYYKRLLKKRI